MQEFFKGHVNSFQFLVMPHKIHVDLVDICVDHVDICVDHVDISVDQVDI